MNRAMTLDQLTTELTDFMDLPGTLDLPAVCSVSLQRNHAAPTWKAEAQLSSGSNGAVWEAIEAWAAACGGLVTVSQPAPSTSQPSGMFRTVQAVVRVAHLSVRVWGHVDGAAELPAKYAELVAS